MHEKHPDTNGRCTTRHFLTPTRLDSHRRHSSHTLLHSPMGDKSVLPKFRIVSRSPDIAADELSTLQCKAYVNRKYRQTLSTYWRGVSPRVALPSSKSWSVVQWKTKSENVLDGLWFTNHPERSCRPQNLLLYQYFARYYAMLSTTLCIYVSKQTSNQFSHMLSLVRLSASMVQQHKPFQTPLH